VHRPCHVRTSRTVDTGRQYSFASRLHRILSGSAVFVVVISTVNTSSRKKSIQAHRRSGEASMSVEKAAGVKKPSQLLHEVDIELRETGRVTDFHDIEFQNKKSSFNQSTVCCCIDPYIDEEHSVYFPGDNIRDGDVYKHRAQIIKMVVCFNICHREEYFTETIIHRALDGLPMKTITVDELNNPHHFFLVKSEPCQHRHHDLRRYTTYGRILRFLCTIPGILSTMRKLFCLEECTNTVHVKTVRCERSLYSRRHF
jgi:hypothetical protein